MEIDDDDFDEFIFKTMMTLVSPIILIISSPWLLIEGLVLLYKKFITARYNKKIREINELIDLIKYNNYEYNELIQKEE